MRVVSVSSKNQITIPVELLKEFHIRSQSKVLIKASAKGILLEPMGESVVDRLAGSLTKYVEPSKLNVPLEKVMEETRKIVAAKLAKK